MTKVLLSILFIAGCTHPFERQYEMKLVPQSEDCDSSGIITCIDRGRVPEHFLVFYHRLQDTTYAEGYARILTMHDEPAMAMFVDTTTEFYKHLRDLMGPGCTIVTTDSAGTPIRSIKQLP